MVYHVNEDKGDNAATVHKDGCGHAKDRAKQREDGQWYGRLTSKDEALAVARNTGRRVVREHDCVYRD